MDRITAMEGVILKALSGFYYVHSNGQLYTCRARGKFRHAGLFPLVGDRVLFTPLEKQTGVLDEILPRRNEFSRPAVANVDQLVIVVSQAVPVTDPFLIDRIVSIAEKRMCGSVICINKCDLDAGDDLYNIYTAAGFPTVRVSAVTGEGMDGLRQLVLGKVSAFTGNSGVGKSSILNCLHPDMKLETGDVSLRLGRGRHTTRHVELHALNSSTLIADTPGFSAFDTDKMELCRKEDIQHCFRDFAPYLDQCQFLDCCHVREKGCAVLQAMRSGKIQSTRHQSYVRLYEQVSAVPDWQR